MIHIILCTYNGVAYIQQQMDSIVQQTNHDWMLHVYDDGSTDGTLDVIKGYSPKLGARLRIHQGQKAGSAKVNFIGGIMNASGIAAEDDFFMLCDQDDVWLDNKIQVTLEEMLRLQHENGDIPLLVCTDSALVDENLKSLSPSFMGSMGFDTTQLNFSHFLMENKAQGSTCMFNKKLADMITFIPQHMDMHDWWLALIASAMGRVSYLNSVTMLYRQHSQAVTAEKMDFWTDFRWKLKNLSKQKYIVYDKIPQATELVEHYGIGPTEWETCQAFIDLPNQGWFKRRRTIVQYKLWKSGRIKNLGLMILI